MEFETKCVDCKREVNLIDNLCHACQVMRHDKLLTRLKAGIAACEAALNVVYQQLPKPVAQKILDALKGAKL